MTAIKKYRRIEAKGLWIEKKGTNPKEVIVSIGKSSITISDLNEVPHNHWNFNSITIFEQDKEKTIFSPGQDRQEKLIIQDQDMIDALNIICEYGKATKKPVIKTSFLLTPILTFLIITFILSVPFTLRLLTLDIINPNHETIFVKNLLEKKEFMKDICTKQKKTADLEDMMVEKFGLKNKMEILITKTAFPSPLLLPGRIVVIPFDWLQQNQSFKNFEKLLHLGIISFRDRRLFRRFLKEQKIRTIFAFNLGIQRPFELILKNYHTSINKQSNYKLMPIGISDEQWVSIKNSCLN